MPRNARRMRRPCGHRVTGVPGPPEGVSDALSQETAALWDVGEPTRVAQASDFSTKVDNESSK